MLAKLAIKATAMNTKILASILTVAIALPVFAQSDQREKRIAWWREARFGMFIHWALYAVPAGERKGQPIPGLGEWIINRAKIPVTEYQQLPKQFNPLKFHPHQFPPITTTA